VTDEITNHTVTATVSDQILTLLAVARDEERGLIIGATIASAAAIAGVTPRELLTQLIDEMPGDELWRTEMAGNAERKVRNARALYRAVTFGFQMKRPQG
jgi:hypothetical protein